MESIIPALVVLLLLHCYLFYAREIRFYAKPKIPKKNYNSDTLYSPVDGRVVYIRKVNKKDFPIVAKKQDRNITLSGIPEGNFLHIGIYLSPMSNHHIMGLFPKSYRVEKIRGELFDMLSSKETVFPLFWWKNWFKKKLEEFIAYNERVNVSYCNNCHMSLIMDKYVNRMEILGHYINGRHCIGFVRRGSQCDLFLPIDEWFENVNVGDRITFKDIVAFRKGDNL